MTTITHDPARSSYPYSRHVDSLLSDETFRRRLPFYGARFFVPLERLAHIEIDLSPADEGRRQRYAAAYAAGSHVPVVVLEIPDGSVFEPTVRAGLPVLAAARAVESITHVVCALYYPRFRSDSWRVLLEMRQRPQQWWTRV